MKNAVAFIVLSLVLIAPMSSLASYCSRVAEGAVDLQNNAESRTFKLLDRVELQQKMLTKERYESLRGNADFHQQAGAFDFENAWGDRGPVSLKAELLGSHLVLRAPDGDIVLKTGLYFEGQPESAYANIFSDGRSVLIELRVVAHHHVLKGDASLLAGRTFPSANAFEEVRYIHASISITR